ncbi:MAG TPA: hypothetical protein VF189_01510, partial [Patescibacteria group bacterium]
EALLSAKEKELIGEDAKRKKKGTLGELSDRIDEASGSNNHLSPKDTVKFSDAQKIFENQFAKRIAEIRGEAAEILAVNDLSKLGNTDSQAVKNKLESTAEYQKKLATESDQDKEDNKDARKQLKQRLGAYARRWGQSFKEWRHAKPEDKAKARKELLLSTRAVAKEAGKRLLIILGIWTIIQFLLMFSGEMRIMGKMFGQDGKG